MWRQAVSRVGDASAPLASIFLFSLRHFFTRSHKSPVSVKKGVCTYPATLLWQWRSDRSRHLVLSLNPPLTQLSIDSVFAASDAGGEHALAEGFSEKQVKPSYTFGRLFLRPINVAQLLAVLQGWADEPVHIVREHTTLTLTPSAAPTALRQGKRAIKASNPAAAAGKALCLSKFTLQGTFTTKSVPALSLHDDVAYGDLEEADQGFANSVYNPDDVRSIELPLEGAELMMLTSHLENVLSDFFNIERCYQQSKIREALRKQHSALRRRSFCGTQYRSQQLSQSHRPLSGYSSDAWRTSQGTVSERKGERHGVVRRVPVYCAAPNALGEGEAGDVAAQGEEVEELDATTPLGAQERLNENNGDVISSAKKDTIGEEEELNEEEEEEVLDIEVDDEMESEGDLSEIERTTARGAVGEESEAAAQVPLKDEANSAFEEIEEEEEAEVLLDDTEEAGGNDSVYESGVIDGATSSSEEPERGHDANGPVHSTEIELENGDHYARVRLKEGNQFTFAAIDEVGSVGDFDVVQKRKLATASGTTGTAETVDAAMAITGLFCSKDGKVTGSYSFNKQSVQTIGAAPATAPKDKTKDDSVQKGEEENAAMDEDRRAENSEASQNVRTTKKRKSRGKQKRSGGISAKRKSSTKGKKRMKSA